MILGPQIKWYDGYLTLAEELGGRTDDASLRSAISRAYYYVYHLALVRAKANNFILNPDEGSHAQLWRLFRENPEPDCKQLALIAQRLKEKRVRADYELTFPRIKDEVPEVLKAASSFAQLLAQLPLRHPNQGSVRRQ